VGGVIDVIRDELRRIADEGCTSDELARAKTQMKGSLLLGLETTDSRMSRIAKNEIYHGREVDLEEVAEAVDAVTNEEIVGLGQRLFGNDRLAAVVLGAPSDGLDEGALDS